MIARTDGRPQAMTPAEFRAARDALSMSQPQLAEALDLHPMTVSKYERGVDPIPRVVELAVRYLMVAPAKLKQKRDASA